MHRIKVAKADVWPVAKRAFPAYNGRKFTVQVTERVMFTDLNWSGGTRYTYRAMLLEGGDVGSLPDRPPWANPAEGATVPLPPGAVVVCHKMFCGKDLGLTIFVNPANVVQLLPYSAGAQLASV